MNSAKVDPGLLEKIIRKKAEMISLGMANGLSHPKTVKVSQELDKLINKVQVGGR